MEKLIDLDQKFRNASRGTPHIVQHSMRKNNNWLLSTGHKNCASRHLVEFPYIHVFEIDKLLRAFFTIVHGFQSSNGEGKHLNSWNETQLILLERLEQVDTISPNWSPKKGDCPHEIPHPNSIAWRKRHFLVHFKWLKYVHITLSFITQRWCLLMQRSSETT